MKNRSISFKDIFIKKMIHSSIVQFMVLLIIIIFARSYLHKNQVHIAVNNLMVKDSFTLDEIGRYNLLNNEYALNMALYNLSNVRRLDFAKFMKSYPHFVNIQYCKNINPKGYKLCKSNNSTYYGISPVSSGDHIIGYIVTRKKYISFFSFPIIYDFFMILLIVAAGFLFNFILLFLLVKKRIEQNTDRLLSFIASNNTMEKPFFEIKEYGTIAKKFAAKTEEICQLQQDKFYDDAVKTVTRQVAHDIKSPLAALETVARHSSDIPEKKRILIREATSNIKDITNNLLYRKSDDELPHNISPQNVMLIPVIESVLSSKRSEFSNRKLSIRLEMDLQAHIIFVRVSINTFKRILSNLCNNAADAVADKSNGEIIVKVEMAKKLVKISVNDNGIGIHPNIIGRVFEEGVTFKDGGSGLGLFHAKTNILMWHGKVNIKSKPNVGTSVIIYLPLQKVEPWFAKEINLSGISSVYIVDDSPPISKIWRDRIESLPERKIKVFYFRDPNKFLAKYKENNKNLQHTSVYLIDYEYIGSNITGIDIIDVITDKSNTFLVTSMAELFNLQQQCYNRNVKLIPKSYASGIPINVLKRGVKRNN